MDGRDKLRELALYIVFGVLTTLVNMGVFQGLEWLLRPRWGDHSYLFSNVMAFIASLVFAFVVNKLYVFQQRSWEPGLVFHEAWTFTAARLFSFGLDYLLTFVFFDLLWPRSEPWFAPLWQRVPVAAEKISPEGAYRFLVKWGIISVLVVILNYFFSKRVVFRARTKEGPA